MKPTPREVAKRLRLMSAILICTCIVILITLLYFQLYRAQFFLDHSRRNFVRYEKVISLRGAIVDRFGKPLATNRPIAQLIWRGSGFRKLTDDQRATLRQIGTILELDLENDVDLATAERYGNEYIIADDLSFERLSMIVEQLPTNPNLIISSSSTRFYPYKTVACHVVGYFRDTPQQKAGTMGLERIFEEELQGRLGAREKLVNARGQSLAYREIQKAEAGKSLQTTVDFTIQSIAEDLFDEDHAGVVIVMDPYMGDLLSVVSRPSFDPNMFVGPINRDVWNRCKEQKPFINRAFNACYPPASIFKLVVTVAALEEKIITPKSTWVCTGEMHFGDRTYHCSRKRKDGGHGVVDFEEAVAKSCNIPFFEIGRRTTIDVLARYARMFGLGQPTGIIFPEKSGLVPTASWKLKQFHEPWRQGETLLAAIGQTYFLVTPLQIARAIGGIYTGALVRPRMLLDEQVQVTPVAISESTRDFIKVSTAKTITRGTGVYLSQLKEIKICGKTGTAQTSTLAKRDLGKKYLEHGWFVCYAQYKDYDPIVLVILAENVGSSRIATRMAKEFFVRYCAYKDGKPIPPKNPIQYVDESARKALAAERINVARQTATDEHAAHDAEPEATGTAAPEPQVQIPESAPAPK